VHRGQKPRRTGRGDVHEGGGAHLTAIGTPFLPTDPWRE
jgi:hypothetical protein